MRGTIFLITGLMASGKSTVAQCLAERFEHAVHLCGDVFRRMIVSGRVDMSADADEEAVRQLYLRYRLSAMTAGSYADQGFTVVLQDNYYGKALEDILSLLEGYTVCTVVLCPDAGTIAKREAAREKKGYIGYDVEPLYRAFMTETPRIGLWIDNAALTAEQTADRILAHYGAIK